MINEDKLNQYLVKGTHIAVVFRIEDPEDKFR